MKKMNVYAILNHVGVKKNIEDMVLQQKCLMLRLTLQKNMTVRW